MEARRLHDDKLPQPLGETGARGRATAGRRTGAARAAPGRRSESAWTSSNAVSKEKSLAQLRDVTAGHKLDAARAASGQRLSIPHRPAPRTPNLCRPRGIGANDASCPSRCRERQRLGRDPGPGLESADPSRPIRVGRSESADPSRKPSLRARAGLTRLRSQAARPDARRLCWSSFPRVFWVIQTLFQPKAVSHRPALARS